MFGAVFALALMMQADAPIATAPGKAADAIGDILAQTPPDAATPPPVPAPEPATRPVVTPELPAQPAAPPIASIPVPNPQRATRYEEGVRSSFQAREARQGPLDGRWTLADADGRALFVFQFADPGPGRGPIEGAWRDMERQGATGSTGFLASASREGQALTITFQEQAQPRVVTLTLGADGRWTGQIHLADQARPVVMTRS